jgi:hypothetical protein
MKSFLNANLLRRVSTPVEAPSTSRTPGSGHRRTPSSPLPAGPGDLKTRSSGASRFSLVPRSMSLPNIFGSKARSDSLAAMSMPKTAPASLVTGSAEVAVTRAQALDVGRTLAARLPADEESTARFMKESETVGKALALLCGDGAEAGLSGERQAAEMRWAATNLRMLAMELRMDPQSGLAKLDPGIPNQLDAFARQMDAHVQVRRDHEQANPQSAQQVFYAKSIATESALHAIDAELARPDHLTVDQRMLFLNARSQLQRRVRDFRAEADTRPLRADETDALMGCSGTDKGLRGAPSEAALRADIQQGADFLSNMPRLPTSDPRIREEGMMQIYLEALYARSGAAQPDLTAALHHGRMAALNGQPWNPIFKEVGYATESGREISVRSEIVPQSRLHSTFGDLGDGGLNCHMTQAYRHAVNASVTRLKMPDGSTAFEGIRHGTLTPYDISGSRLKKMTDAELSRMVSDLLPAGNRSGTVDETVARIRSDKSYRYECADRMREAGASSRAKDLATMALVKDEAKLAAALAGEPVRLDITSISLLTPDLLRSLGAKGKSKGINERLMLQDQLKAWDGLNGPQTLKVKDGQGREREVTVDVRVNAFNFGVNGLAFNKSKLPLLTGWGRSDERNTQSMQSLLGDASKGPDGALGGQVGAWLAKNPDHPDAAHVRTLGTQVRQIWNDKSYRGSGSEPYKLVKRLAVLNSMMGEDVFFNCKSGKDRTGQGDVEAKLLAVQIEDEGKVPEPQAAASSREKANMFRMATQGGNFEYQKLNTGAAGFKLAGVSSLAGQLADVNVSAHFKYFRGISRYFGS